MNKERKLSRFKWTLPPTLLKLSLMAALSGDWLKTLVYELPPCFTAILLSPHISNIYITSPSPLHPLLLLKRPIFIPELFFLFLFFFLFIFRNFHSFFFIFINNKKKYIYNLFLSILSSFFSTALFPTLLSLPPFLSSLPLATRIFAFPSPSIDRRVSRSCPFGIHKHQTTNRSQKLVEPTTQTTVGVVLKVS